MNYTTYTDLITFAKHVLDFVISISALIAVISLVITGFTYILSMGDDKKIEKANKSLLFTLVGLVVCFIAPMIIRFILEKFLGQ